MGDKKLNTAPRDHMANERTFLAWMRTSIGVMAFGFVIEKFAVFLKRAVQFLKPEHGVQLSPTAQESPIVFGILLIAIGALMGLFAFINYKKIERQIESGTYESHRPLATLLTVLVMLTGIVLIVYLIRP